MKWYYKIFLLLIFLVAACIKEENPSIKRGVWSGNNPLSIPYRKRINEFESGNKVENGSFEEGRYFKNNYNTFEISGWKEMQGGIDWVDKKRGIYDKNEIYSGSKALKLEKKSIDETENEHIGILSDFIKVIPGKYDLSYRIKLENINPAKQRLGARLMETINVRVYFYDKNKIRISGNTVNPITGFEFDNEFKAFPFSAFWQIDSMDWIKAKGISYKFPFPDGIIPDETRYVRLYFGLNGTGTMWLDDVCFKYSRDNFSIKEKAEPFFNKKPDKVDLLVPMPQHVDKKSFVDLAEHNENSKIAIITPINPDKKILETANRLKDTITSACGKGNADVSILPGDYSYPVSENSIIFSLGTNNLSDRHKDSLPYENLKNHQQSYFIKNLIISDKSFVFLDGDSQESLYYSLQTLIHLFDSQKHGFYRADIIDYPDFVHRALISSTSKINPEHNKVISDLRLTHIFYETDSLSNLNFSNTLDKLRQIALNDFLQPGICFKLYDKENLKSHLKGDETQIKTLKSKIKKADKENIKNVLIRADLKSFPCNFSFRNNENSLKYRNLLDLHSEMLKDIEQNTSQKMEINFIPTWSNSQCIRKSQGRGELYLSELSKKTSQKTCFGWKGPDESFYQMDEVEINYISQMLSKFPFFFAETINPQSQNTFGNDFIQAFPGKARNCSMFNHFNLKLPDDLEESLKNQLFLISHHFNNLFEEIRLSTYSDYLWNSDYYDPEESLFRILINQYGQQNAINLIKFNDLIYAVYEMHLKSQMIENNKKFMRSANDYMSQLTNVYNQLKSNLQNEMVQNALDELKKRTDQFYQDTGK